MLSLLFYYFIIISIPHVTWDRVKNCLAYVLPPPPANALMPKHMCKGSRATTHYSLYSLHIGNGVSEKEFFQMFNSILKSTKTWGFEIFP